jgi:hypothetical protein
VVAEELVAEEVIAEEVVIEEMVVEEMVAEEQGGGAPFPPGGVGRGSGGCGGRSDRRLWVRVSQSPHRFLFESRGVRSQAAGT